MCLLGRSCCELKKKNAFELNSVPVESCDITLDKAAMHISWNCKGLPNSLPLSPAKSVISILVHLYVLPVWSYRHRSLWSQQWICYSWGICTHHHVNIVFVIRSLIILNYLCISICFVIITVLFNSDVTVQYIGFATCANIYLLNILIQKTLSDQIHKIQEKSYKTAGSSI